MKLYNLGSLNIDYVYDVEHFVRAGETISSQNMQIFPGGKGLNQSIALSRAGGRVLHGAVVGSDGELLRKTLADARVDISRIKHVDGSCGHAIIQVDQNGENCILLFPGTNHAIEEDYIESFLFDAQEGDILLLQNEINALDTAFEKAAQKKMQIAFNPSPIADNIKSLPLSFVTWWFCNEIEAESLFGETDADAIKESFLRMYPNSNLILTLGKDGARLINHQTDIYQPAYPVKTVDTTAAGDTFTGYFLSLITNGASIQNALKTAAKAAAVAVSRKGAAQSIPLIQEL